MRFKSATAAVLVAGLILSPVARAEEAAAQQEYDRKYLSFDDFGAIDPHTGTFYQLTVPYQGKYRDPIAPGAFYRLVGREDLAQQYEGREQARTTLHTVGTLTFLAGAVGAAVVAFGSSSSCDPSNPGFAQCASAAEDDARSRGLMSLALVGVGAVLGGSIYLAGSQMDPQPVNVAAQRELADQYNQKLRMQLGLSVIDKSDGGGLALSARF